jgi:hypothetical protein
MGYGNANQLKKEQIFVELSQEDTCPPVIFPLHLQNLPDGFHSLAAVDLAPYIRELSETPAHTHADPDQADQMVIFVSFIEIHISSF